MMAPMTGIQGGLAIIGGGKIGEALLSGLLRGHAKPQDIVVVEKYPERVTYLTARYGVRVVDVDEAVRSSRTVLIAVKPQDIDPLLDELAGSVTTEHLIVSIAAGIPTSHIEAALPAGVPVVRCMSAGSLATDEHLGLADTLLSAVGRVVQVPESQLDAVTALSGSGPAYFFFLVEAMIDAGILLGLPRALAAELIVQTLFGSAVMLRDSGEHPVRLREAVTSPGGTTISAIRELENHGVRAAFLAAIEAASNRSAELGRASGG
jgi:pyrroline-5-carboxylate reductase